MNLRTITSLFVALALGAPVFAAETPEKGKKAGAKSDQAFVTTAAQIGIAEVKLGQMASEKAAAAEVKEFGTMMVTDHTKVNDELKALATGKGLEVPADTDAKHKATAEKLSKLSGAEFDKAYADEMVKGHIKAIKEFEAATKSVKDPEVKAFAEKNIPALQHHLEGAKALQKAGGKEKAGKEKKS